MFSPSSSTLALVAGVVVLAGYLLYRATFPKPIPGIPYVEKSVNRPFGDVPDFLKHIAETEEITKFCTSKLVELNSPVIQLFVRPFSKPWVILGDAQEAQDLLTRRSREFDRSNFFIDLMHAILPHGHVQMKTNDQWHANRRLVADTMSRRFLESTVGPQVHSAFIDLVHLWCAKAPLAMGHPLSVEEDIKTATMDAITAAAFGNTQHATRAQLALMQSLPRLHELSQAAESVAVFPRAADPLLYAAFMTVIHSSEIPIKSPLGGLHHEFAIRFYPGLRSAKKLSHSTISSQLDMALQKFTSSGSTEEDTSCAADLMVAREVALAQKQRRAPRHKSPDIRDELFTFIIAGFDTTATSLEWAVKYLTHHQDVQQKLRLQLRDIFPQAAKDRKSPSSADIAKTATPYLDAVVEEVLRCSNTVANLVRVATVDTELLGYHIPKGTDIFIMNTGPSYHAPPIPIDDKKRTQSSRQRGDTNWNAKWDPSTLGDFMPERWLVQRDEAGVEFDSRAGPMHTFGAGPRGCFGRKMAHLTLRIAIALIIWNLDLQHIPEELQDFRALDSLTHHARHVYVRLATV